MSYQSSAYLHGSDSGHHVDRKGQPKGQKPAHHRKTDYTLIHAGRQVRLGPVAFWVVVGTLVAVGTDVMLEVIRPILFKKHR